MPSKSGIRWRRAPVGVARATAGIVYPSLAFATYLHGRPGCMHEIRAMREPAHVGLVYSTAWFEHTPTRPPAAAARPPARVGKTSILQRQPQLTLIVYG